MENILNLFFRPKHFFESVKNNKIPFIFGVFCVFASYILTLLINHKYRVFIPYVFTQTNSDIIIQGVGNLLFIPLLFWFFLRRSSNRCTLRSIFVAYFSTYLISILAYVVIFILGISHLLNKSVYFYTMITFIIWQLLILILAIRVLSEFSKIKSGIIVIMTIFIVAILCYLIGGIPEVISAWQKVNQETAKVKPYPYNVKFSNGKILTYNMNPLQGDPDPIRCIDKEGKSVNIYVRVQFQLIVDRLQEMYKKFKDLDGNYEPEMNFQISDAIKRTVAKNYLYEEMINSRSDEFKKEIIRRVKQHLSTVGIDLLSLEIIKIERIKR